jgi:hypothetical protein
MPLDTTAGVAVNRQTLIRRLRDPSTKLLWNFTHSQRCAMGIASEIHPGWTNRTFGLSHWQVLTLFGVINAWFYGKLFRSQVTPDMVADALERAPCFYPGGSISPTANTPFSSLAIPSFLNASPGAGCIL